MRFFCILLDRNKYQRVSESNRGQSEKNTNLSCRVHIRLYIYIYKSGFLIGSEQVSFHLLTYGLEGGSGISDFAL